MIPFVSAPLDHAVNESEAAPGLFLEGAAVGSAMRRRHVTGQSIFISYHRDDAAADANALYQSLRAEFGDHPIFKDVDNVPLGANWKSTVREAVLGSAVVVMVMGRGWRYSDAIQIEVETALEAGLPIIPLLMNGTRMEDVTGDLTGEAAVLAELNAAAVDHSSWNRDLIPVLEALHTILGTQSVPTGKPPQRSEIVEIQDRESTDTDKWTAELVGFTEHTTFAIDLRLTSSSFRIEWRSGWITNSVYVDGETASTRPAITNNEIHVFGLREDHRRHEAVLELTGGVLVLNRIVLTVDSQVLLDARRPFGVRP